MSGRILLVEDDSTIAGRVRNLLSSDGHAIIPTAGRSQVLDRMTEKACDVVILEVSLLDPDGPELMQAITHTDPAVQIIVLIRNRSDDVISQALQYRGYDFLHIPDEIDYRLRPMARRAVATCRGHRQAGREKKLLRKMAHDLRNMLSAMMGYTFLIEEKLEAGNPLGAYAARTQERGQRALTLTDALTAFAQNEHFSPQFMDPNEVIQTLESMVRRLLPQDMTLHLNLEPDTNQIRVDRTQFEYIIMILAATVRDAMPSNGCMVLHTSRIALSGHDPGPADLSPGVYIRLEVRDTETSRMADLSAAKSQKNDMDSGLAAVQEIMRRNGGGLVISEPGKGLALSVYLPAYRKDE